MSDSVEPHDYARMFVADRDIEVAFWRGDYYKRQRGEGRFVKWEELAMQVEVQKYLAQKGFCKPLTIRKIKEVLNGLNILTHFLPDMSREPMRLEDGQEISGALALDDGLYYGEDGRTESLWGVFSVSSSTASIASIKRQNECPRFMKFVHEIFEGDEEQIHRLQCGLGFIVFGDVKEADVLFVLVGPPRSGKSTLKQVLENILGEENVVSMSLASMGSTFGLSEAMNAKLITTEDERMSRSPEQQTQICSKLLSITGRDKISIDRKYRDKISIRLSAKIMIVSNEFPELRDSRGAMQARLYFMKTVGSFVGKEDYGLTQELQKETPGIIDWLADGYRQFKEAGSLPKLENEALIEEAQEHMLSLKDFVDECLEVGEEAHCTWEEVYACFVQWANLQGRGRMSKPILVRELKATLETLKINVHYTQSPAKDGPRKRVLRGVGIRTNALQDMMG